MLEFHSEMGSTSSPGRGKRWLWIAASFTLGLAAIGSVIYQAGAGATREVLVRALPFLPWVVLLEGCRIGTEVLAARDVFRLLRARVPTWALVKAQVVGYSICNVLPVGRMASEAAKAGLLKSHAKLSETAAVAAVAQALHLVASAVILLPGFWAVRAAGGSVALSWAILGQCVLLAAIGATFLVVARFVPLDRILAGRLPRVSAALERFRLAMGQLPHFPFSSLGWLVVNRALQVALIAVLLRAVGCAWSVSHPVGGRCDSRSTRRHRGSVLLFRQRIRHDAAERPRGGLAHSSRAVALGVRGIRDARRGQARLRPTNAEAASGSVRPAARGHERLQGVVELARRAHPLGSNRREDGVFLARPAAVELFLDDGREVGEVLALAS